MTIQYQINFPNALSGKPTQFVLSRDFESPLFEVVEGFMAATFTAIPDPDWKHDFAAYGYADFYVGGDRWLRLEWDWDATQPMTLVDMGKPWFID